MGEDLYRFLLLYYLDDLSSPPYEEEILNSPNQRETINSYLAAWSESDENIPRLFEKFCGEPKAGK